MRNRIEAAFRAMDMVEAIARSFGIEWECLHEEGNIVCQAKTPTDWFLWWRVLLKDRKRDQAGQFQVFLDQFGDDHHAFEAGLKHDGTEDKWKILVGVPNEPVLAQASRDLIERIGYDRVNDRSWLTHDQALPIVRVILEFASGLICEASEEQAASAP